jgi:hypothetical protein
MNCYLCDDAGHPSVAHRIVVVGGKPRGVCNDHYSGALLAAPSAEEMVAQTCSPRSAALPEDRNSKFEIRKSADGNGHKPAAQAVGPGLAPAREVKKEETKMAGRIDIEELRKLQGENLPAVEIGRRMNKCRATVEFALKKLGLEPILTRRRPKARGGRGGSRTAPTAQSAPLRTPTAQPGRGGSRTAPTAQSDVSAVTVCVTEERLDRWWSHLSLAEKGEIFEQAA